MIEFIITNNGSKWSLLSIWVKTLIRLGYGKTWKMPFFRNIIKPVAKTPRSHWRMLAKEITDKDIYHILVCGNMSCSDCDTHTHPFNGPFCPGLPKWAGTRKVKPIWILLKQETVSGSGISWGTCKSAPHSRQITMPVPHHSRFLQAGCPSCRPTNSVKALKANALTVILQYNKVCGQSEVKNYWHYKHNTYTRINK